MKKLIVLMAILAIAVPAMAAVEITVADGANAGEYIIGYDATGEAELPRAFGLVITLTDGATVTSAVSVTDDFYVTPIEFVLDEGTPENSDFGNGIVEAESTTTTVVIEMGSLYVGEPNAPLASGDLVKLTVAGTGKLTVELDATRGGIVMEDAQAAVDPVLPSLVDVTEGSTDCVKDTAPFYAAWVSFGKPDCWCYARNCRGDADNMKQGTIIAGYTYVYTNDLNVLVSAWNVKEAPKGPGIMSVTNGICADFNRDQQGTIIAGYARVYTNDLNVLVANWNVKEAPKGVGIPDCMDTGHYNTLIAPFN